MSMREYPDDRTIADRPPYIFLRRKSDLPKKHVCDLPHAGNAFVGDVVQCTVCNKRWRKGWYQDDHVYKWIRHRRWNPRPLIERT